MELQNTFAEHILWKIKATIKTAEQVLSNPHPLWSELNELMEIVDVLENKLTVLNNDQHGI